jgi:hypothetical protein
MTMQDYVGEVGCRRCGVVLEKQCWSRNTKAAARRGEATMRSQMQFHDSDSEL